MAFVLLLVLLLIRYAVTLMAMAYEERYAYVVILYYY